MGFWQRQKDAMAAMRSLYREHGVLVLSPRILRLVGQRTALEHEVAELRSRHRKVHEELVEQEVRYRAEIKDRLRT